MYLRVVWSVTLLGFIHWTSGQHCPNGTHNYRSSCFFVVNEVRTHYKATERCPQLQDGARLAAPKDYSTQHFIKNLVHGGQYNSYWIGLTETGPNVWTFSDNTTLGTFTYWAPREPGGASDEDCVLLGSAVQTEWVTTQCHWGYRFICQLDLCNTLTLSSQNLTPSSSGLVRVGTTVSVKCAEGRGVFSGEEQVRCAPGGQWELNGRCLLGCPPPQLGREVVLVRARSSYRVGERPEVTCEDSNSVLIDSGITCSVNGRWMGRSPECKPRQLQVAQPSTIHTVTVGNRFAPVPSSTVKFPDEPDMYTVRMGSSLSVTCLKNDRRTPSTWIWKKEQHILQRPNTSIPHVKVHANGTLHIARMTSQAEGLYTCLAESLSGKSVEERTLYVVMPKSCNHLQLEITPNSDQFNIGEYVVLRCYASNTITMWFQGDKRIHHIDDGSPQRVLRNGALIVNKSQLQQSTSFKCVVEDPRTLCRINRTVEISPNGDIPRVNLTEVCGLTPALNQVTLPPYTHGKIVGGHEAIRGSHPWVVMFETTENGQVKFICGGNLVSDQWVVTAAHCFYWVNSTEQVSSIRTKLGKHDRRMTEPGERALGVSLIKIHPNFDASLQSFDNDLALVRLEEKVRFSSTVVPICLPEPGFIDKYYPVQFAKSSGLVSGWGRLQEDGLQPNVMHQVRLPLVDIDLCRSSTDQLVTPNMFCAGYSQSVGDSCQGDSGGPFEMRSENGRVYLAGLVSWGEGCSREGKYGFYTRIQNYHNFIQRHIND